MLSRGVKFITSYRKVYTTRLHVMILSVLLGKEVQYINNNNGKLEALYNTWLRDCEGVSKFKRVGDE
jgi:pyruvyl transferase EpsO